MNPNSYQSPQEQSQLPPAHSTLGKGATAAVVTAAATALMAMLSQVIADILGYGGQLTVPSKLFIAVSLATMTCAMIFAFVWRRRQS